MMNRDSFCQRASSSNIASKHFPSELRPFVKTVLRRLKSPRSGQVLSSNSLQNTLDKLVSERGYSTSRLESLKSTYSKNATSHQKDSFGTRILEILQRSDIESLRKLFSAGLSPNPYDTCTGEYLIHIACQRGNWEMVQVMIEFGGNEIVQTVDTYGRTPLHILCLNWASEYKSFDSKHPLTMLLECDRQLLYMTDCHKEEPLSYVQRAHYNEFIHILEYHKEHFWPSKSSVLPRNFGKRETQILTFAKQKDTITSEIALMLSSGRMDPEEVILFQYDRRYHQSDRNGYKSDERVARRVDIDSARKLPNTNGSTMNEKDAYHSSITASITKIPLSLMNHIFHHDCSSHSIGDQEIFDTIQESSETDNFSFNETQFNEILKDLDIAHSSNAN
jgi:ankyrin repeat protein